MSQGFIDLPKMVDVAENHREGALVADRPLDFSWEVLAKKAPAGGAGQFIGRCELTILLERDPHHGVELGNATSHIDARVEFPVRCASPDTLIGAGRESRFPFGSLVKLGA